MEIKSSPVVFKNASIEDAKSYGHLRLALHAETEFLRLSPDEKILLQKNELPQKDLLLLGFIKQDPIAFLEASFDRSSKKIHSVQLGVLKSRAGFGIGSQLFLELEKWAQEMGAQTIELKVMTHNLLALEMYKRRNFIVGEINHFKLYGTEQMLSDYKLAKSLI